VLLFDGHRASARARAPPSGRAVAFAARRILSVGQARCRDGRGAHAGFSTRHAHNSKLPGSPTLKHK
jgi:hypothetical protein